MNSKQIAVEYLAPKISNPAMIFKNIDIFKSILPWAKDSAKEFFETQTSKMFLTSYLDDVAPIVDEYLINRAAKMYKKAIKSQNKLFSNLCSSEKTVAWIIDRWINTFINLTSNSKYRDYINISKIKVAFDSNMDFFSSNIDEIIEFEKLKKLPKKLIRKALKKIWEDAKYDSDFDFADFEELCSKFKFNAREVVGSDTLAQLKFSKSQVSNKHSQLELLF